MPNNWKTYKLGDIADFGYGKMPKKNLLNTGVYPAFSGYRKVGMYPEKNCEKGDVIVVARGVGGTGDVKLTKFDCFLTNISIRIGLNENICSNNYFYYKYLRTTLRFLRTGSAQPQITINDLKSLDVSLPLLPEQKAIASILSSIDHKIENNLAMNLTLEEMAMALYKHWFVDFGPFQDGKFVDSELGEIPEGWEVKTIGDVAQVNKRSLKKDHNYSEINYIDISSVGTGLVESYNTIAADKAPSRAKRILKDGDIVWSTVRPTRRSYFLALGFPENTVVSTGFAVISPVKVPYAYLYPLTFTVSFVDYLDSRSTGAAYPAVTGKVFEQAKIIVPDSEILNEYSEIVSVYYKKISLNLEENQTLIEQRDYLSPKLISGEVRVNKI